MYQFQREKGRSADDDNAAFVKIASKVLRFWTILFGYEINAVIYKKKKKNRKQFSFLEHGYERYI